MGTIGNIRKYPYFEIQRLKGVVSIFIKFRDVDGSHAVDSISNSSEMADCSVIVYNGVDGLPMGVKLLVFDEGTLDNA